MTDEQRINVMLEATLDVYYRIDVIKEFINIIDDVDDILKEINGDDIIAHYEDRHIELPSEHNEFDDMKDLLGIIPSTPYNEIDVYKNYVNKLTKNLEKQRMLEYLIDHFNEITLEDLETIIKNK